MTYIPFKAKNGSNKPNTLINKEQKCPFCNREELKKEGRVIRETDNFIIVGNKYPVMKNTFPTVLIEHKNCEEHIGTYSFEYLIKLLDFSIGYYNELNSESNYKSIVFFKNHGIFSGGSIKHPHMQIIGLQEDSYEENIPKSDFEGETVISNELIEWNLSTKPRSEFYEINIILKDKKRLDLLATHLQKSVNFILEKLNPKFQCYNLTFFIDDDCIKVKVISRGPASVLLLGFGIHQTPDNLIETAELLRNY